MKRAQPNKPLSIGIKVIDEQHNIVLTTLDSFIEIAASCNKLEKIKREFVKLNIFIDNHLFSEEELLKQYNPHNYEEHLKEHTIMKDKLMQVYNILQLNVITGFSKATLKSLKEPIVHHIKETDMKSFANKKNKLYLLKSSNKGSEANDNL